MISNPLFVANPLHKCIVKPTPKLAPFSLTEKSFFSYSEAVIRLAEKLAINRGHCGASKKGDESIP